MGTNTMALIQTCQIQAIMTVPERLSFSAQLSNCNLATCWHIELSILGILHLSISIQLSNSFTVVVLWNSFLSWPWANLALLAQRQKNTDVYKGLLPWEGFPGQTWSLCHGNQHHGIDPNMSNSGHHDCSRKAVFLCTADKLQCWPMLARNGTYWCMLAFSFLHLSFIRTIASVVLSSSFIWK